MTGRPPVGPPATFRLGPTLTAKLAAEARRRKLSVSAMLRHILTERYEGTEK